MSDNISTLESGCDEYVGRTLIVEPQNGYGWRHPPTGPFGTHGVPPPFRLMVQRVYSYKNERRGVVARVAEAGFAYDGFWLVSMTRHVGVWNFAERPAMYNLLLCPEEPLQGQEEDSPMYGKTWPVWHLRGEPHVSGFGRIAESLEACAAYDAKLKAQQGDSLFHFAGTIVPKRDG